MFNIMKYFSFRKRNKVVDDPDIHSETGWNDINKREHPPDFKIYIGKQAIALKFACRFRGWTLARLLKEMGFSRRDYRRFKAGEIGPDGREWMRINKLLNLPPATVQIMADDETPDRDYEIRIGGDENEQTAS